MLAFPGMLVAPAEKAGIQVPEDPNNFDSDDYIRFAIFCQAHWANAKIIASIPEDQLKTITMGDLCGLGYQ